MTTLQILSWQRTTVTEKKKPLLASGLILLVGGIALIKLNPHKENYLVFGYIVLAFAAYSFLKYFAITFWGKATDTCESSLQITPAGLLYTLNTVKRFFLFKEIRSIKAENNNIILRFDNFEHDRADEGDLVIPNSVFTPSFSKEFFINNLLSQLPAANKIDPSQPLPPPPKTSYLFVYIGIAIIVCIAVAMMILSNIHLS